MKIKTILILSLAINVVLVSTLAYMHSLAMPAAGIPPVVYIINRSTPGAVAAALEVAAGRVEAPR